MVAIGYTSGDPRKLDRGGYVKGDVVAADIGGLLQAVPIGAPSNVLTVNPAAPEDVDWEAGGGGGGSTPSNTVVTEQGYGQAPSAGLSVLYSRGDHTHGTTDLNDLTFTGQTEYGQSASIPVGLADAPTIAVDASLGNHFRVTLGGNRLLANPTGALDGQHILFELIKDATGSRLLTLATKYALGTTIPVVTLSLTPSKRDFLLVTYNQITDKFYVIAFVRGY